MPSFGFNKDEAAAIAAFLQSVSKPVKLAKLPKVKRRKPRRKSKYDDPKPPLSDVRAGEVLVRSVGCLACHSVGKRGSRGPYAGGDLSSIGDKHSAEWLYQWLRDPKMLNADHRMPVFKLSTLERRQIALFLAGKKTGKKSGARQPAGEIKNVRAANADRIALGKRLVTQARCAACHTIPGVKFVGGKVPDLSGQSPSLRKSCVQQAGANHPKGARQPKYAGIDHAAIHAFLNSRAGKLAPKSEFEIGQLVLERRNCTACHPRGLQRGIVETAGIMSRIDNELQGQSQALIPPALNAVGDKLVDAYLKTAIAGEQKAVRMPWLRVRMPRFAHSKNHSNALQRFLIAHDRIPAGVRHTAQQQPAKMPTDSQVLVAGQTLLGIRGFSCIACHKAGEYEPRNVAIGTRGSDLMQLAGRMRKPFFDRWTRSPVRIVPGMEMPSYHGKPVPGVLESNVDLQLEVLWRALNDKRFRPPTNPSVVEQFLTVKPGEPARIVRDVFTVPKENGGGYVARSLAIGLNNGHNILFDLDTYSLRGWYFGDFARQRTQGKSWYWDMAGVPVMTGLTEGPDIVLVKKDPKTGKDKVYTPLRANGTVGRLVSADVTPVGVTFHYELNFDLDGRRQTVVVVESLRTNTPRGKEVKGWIRSIEIMPITRAGQQKGQPAVLTGYQAYCARPVAATSIGKSRIEHIDPQRGTTLSWRRFDGIDHREYTPAQSDRRGTTWSATLRYSTSLVREHSKVRVKPRKVKPLVAEQITTVPGFNGTRLPIDRGIMPTAMTWTDSGKLIFASLKGDVFEARDVDSDTVEDRLHRLAYGLAAPFGVASRDGEIIVSHKPELVRLQHSGVTRNSQKIVASGWGYNDNYHDWTCGIVRDRKGNLYVGLGSDYAQKNRPKEESRWRGKVLRIGPDGKITPVGHSFRYPTGLAINDSGDIFVTDNQGVQNTFNEINHLQPGRHYGVPSRHEPNRDAPVTPPAIQVPHPWTRSVNGIFFLPNKAPATRRSQFVQAFAGHGIGCEYDNRFLIRFSLQKVDGVMQGACYAFSKPNSGVGGKNFTGPLCGGVAPDGAIYIGSIYDSGWLGGRNTGDIVRLVPNGKLPNGIRELRATADGFEIEFIQPVNREEATKPASYSISGYTRVWKGSYATPDSGRHTLKVTAAVLSKNGKYENAVSRCREVAGIPDNYHVLFLQGGASSQFFMVPMNFLTPGATADYLVTGAWSKKAIAEAKRFGNAFVSCSSEEENFCEIPEERAVSESPVYTHFTSNNTIFGTQFATEPETPNGGFLVCDASSDIFSRPIDVSKYGIIYAGSQKNLGPSGVTLVIIRDDLVESAAADLPTMLQYRTHSKSDSMFNTPPTFPIYMMGLVFKWILDSGGLSAMEDRNRDKAGRLYDFLDQSELFSATAEKGSRSQMNVTFVTGDPEIDAKFIAGAKEAGFDGLKGHRSVGGMRASIYNAFPSDGVDALIEFAKNFEASNG
eukprot:g26536.t1